jgi:hypothetical protein
MGRLAGSRLARFEEHLLICESCQASVEQADLFLAGVRMALQAAAKERRRAPRRRCRRTVTVMMCGKKSVVQGRAVDRSETGMGLRLGIEMPAGACVLVAVGSARYRGEVAWCVPQGADYRLPDAGLVCCRSRVVGCPASGERQDLAASGEEALEHCHALGGKDALGHLDAVIQDLGIGDTELTADAAETQVARTENQAADARVNQGAGAHHARFERDIERRTLQTVIAELAGGLTQHQHFGVGGGIVQRNGLVKAGSQQLRRGGKKDGADGNFLARDGQRGLLQRQAHRGFIVRKRRLVHCPCGPPGISMIPGAMS